MLKFSMKNHRVIVDPVSLVIESLREIWMSDKSTVKKEATDLLTYIQVCSQIDTNAPFFGVDPTEVSSLIKRELFGKYEHKFTGKFDEEYMANAVMTYQLAFDAPENAAVRVFDKKIYEITRLIDETKIEIKATVVRGGVEYVSNFPIINKMMQDLTKIGAARENLKATTLKQKKADAVRGQKQISFLERRRAEQIKAGIKLGTAASSPATGDEAEGEEDF